MKCMPNETQIHYIPFDISKFPYWNQDPPGCASPKFTWYIPKDDWSSYQYVINSGEMKFLYSYSCNITCPKNCDNCLLFEVDDIDTTHRDTMCLKKHSEYCIWTGNLINDGSYVAVTSHIFEPPTGSACHGDMQCPHCNLGKMEVCIFCSSLLKSAKTYRGIPFLP